LSTRGHKGSQGDEDEKGYNTNRERSTARLGERHPTSLQFSIVRAQMPLGHVRMSIRPICPTGKSVVEKKCHPAIPLKELSPPRNGETKSLADRI
jgi:hypothetical protein